MATRMIPKIVSHTTSPSLSNLPPEIVLLILSHLPIPSLLSFGLTSRKHRAYTVSSLTSLRLAIFPKRVHALIAFLETWGVDTSSISTIISTSPHSLPHNHVPVILPSPPSYPTWSKPSRRLSSPSLPSSRPHKSHKSCSGTSSGSSNSNSNSCPSSTDLSTTPLTTPQITAAQNHLLAQILIQYGPSLHDLDFIAFDLTPHGALALSAYLPSLRHLALRFNHEHIRNRDIDRSFWDHPSPGSPVWNFLGGVEKDVNGVRNETVLRNLESLVMERVGITGWQLQKFIEKNPRLKDLRLKKCAGVRPEFLAWLSEKWSGREKLQVLWLENCGDIVVVATHDGVTTQDDDGLGWVDGLTGLESLSFRHCPNIDTDVVRRANERWRIKDLILPYSPRNPRSDVLEVDPAFK